MKIALDGTPLTVPTGGITRYVAELSRALASNFPEDDCFLLADRPFRTPAGDTLPNLHAGGHAMGLLERRWWLWGVQRAMSRLGVTLFHGTDFSVPYLPLRPSVMTIHDLSPWKNPKWHYAAERVRRRSPYLAGLGLATMIVTPSRAIRAEVMEQFGIAAGRVAAIPLAAPANFRPVAAAGRNGAPYFLYVGTLEPRKNIPLLVEAWREVRRRHAVDLVLAGRRREDFPALAAEDGLRTLGEVREEDLPALYSGAAAVVYPSFYEGFGLPVLEAMQCGAPVIASRDPAIAEAAGGAAELLDAADERAWVSALEAVLVWPDLACRMKERGLRRAAEFSWAAAALRTREVYAEAAERFRAGN